MNVEQAINAADESEAEGLRGLYPTAAQVLAAELRELEPVAWMVEDWITVREDLASMLGWAGAVVGTGRAIPCSWRPMLYAATMRHNV